MPLYWCTCGHVSFVSVAIPVVCVCVCAPTVISSNRSTTGKPILANDPHLPLTAPALWHQSHLTFISHRVPDQPRRVHMSGFTMPLLPGVMAGQNDYGAWGITLANADVEDIFLERFTSPDNSTYLFEGKSLPVQERVELIHVKGRAEPVEYVVRSTHHGPLVSHVFGTNGRCVCCFCVIHVCSSFLLCMYGSSCGLEFSTLSWFSPSTYVYC
jgi:acyl-homoserine lactone acylase PvdQ